MEKKWDTVIPADLKKTLCKWHIYVLLVTKGLIASSENTDFSRFNLHLHHLYSRDCITGCLLDIYMLEIEILLKKMRHGLGFRPISIQLILSLEKP